MIIYLLFALLTFRPYALILGYLAYCYYFKPNHHLAIMEYAQKKLSEHACSFLKNFADARNAIACVNNTMSSGSKYDGFKPIKDQYESLDDLKRDLVECGLESSRMIIGIDFTASNESKGAVSFGGKSLHTLSNNALNPYQETISIMAKTLSGFDENNEYLCYGFGDIKTKDKTIFNLMDKGNEAKRSRLRCKSLDELFSVYNEVVKKTKMSGPTSFAPLIREAISVCKSENQYYILLIITDGETLTPEEDAKAIVEASEYPLSIICVGVGDGPWGTMKLFDDELPERKFDNFQLAIFNEVTKHEKFRETDFARRALMEIPEQFNAIKKLGYLKKSYKNENILHKLNDLNHD